MVVRNLDPKVKRLKQAEYEYLSLLANHCDMEVPGIVETMERHSAFKGQVKF